MRIIFKKLNLQLICSKLFFWWINFCYVFLLNMKLGQGGDNGIERPKVPTGTHSSLEKAIDREIGIFLNYVKNLPRIFQKRMAPYVAELKNEYPNDQRLKEAFSSLYSGNQQPFQGETSNQSLIHTINQILQLANIQSILKRITQKLLTQNAKSFKIKKVENSAKLSPANNIQKLDLFHPEYDIYYRMSKQERGHSLMQLNTKVKQSYFYVEPRFILKLDELNHFQNADKHRGNILYLQYHGNLIRGRKVYAIANENSIEVWERESYQPPTVNIYEETQQEDGQENKAVEKKEEVKLNNKLQFSFKFIGHIGRITSISFSSDEYYMISGGVDMTIKLWCLRLNILLAEYKSHSKAVFDVDFSVSGYFFLSGGADGFVFLWKTDVPNPQRVFNHKMDVYKVKFARDPSYAISAGENSSIKIWKILDATLVQQIKFENPIYNFCFGFSGVYMAVTELGGKITIINFNEGSLVNSFSVEDPNPRKRKQSNPKLQIHDLAFSEEQNEFVCISNRHIIIYSMDRLKNKESKNIFSIFDESASMNTKVVPKQVISMGIDINLTFCTYTTKNVLVVGGHYKKI